MAGQKRLALGALLMLSVGTTWSYSSNSDSENNAAMFWMMTGFGLFAWGGYATEHEVEPSFDASKTEPTPEPEPEPETPPEPPKASPPNIYVLACQDIGLPTRFTPTQLKVHWRTNCKKWHPDTGGNHELWLQKQSSYELLVDLVESRKATVA